MDSGGSIIGTWGGDKLFFKRRRGRVSDTSRKRGLEACRVKLGLKFSTSVPTTEVKPRWAYINGRYNISHMAKRQRVRQKVPPPSSAAKATFWLAVQACVGSVSCTLTISSLAHEGYTAYPTRHPARPKDLDIENRWITLSGQPKRLPQGL